MLEPGFGGRNPLGHDIAGWTKSFQLVDRKEGALSNPIENILSEYVLLIHTERRSVDSEETPRHSAMPPTNESGASVTERG